MRRRNTDPSPLRGAIAAVAGECIEWSNAIGTDDRLPWKKNRSDLKYFKRRTLGCAIIMGRVTWDSIGRKELPGRRNIVVSRSTVSYVEHYGSIEDAIAACGNHDWWVIGGGQIYRAAMKYLNLLDITEMPETVERTDVVKFPKIDESIWRQVYKRKVPGGGRLLVAYRRVDDCVGLGTSANRP